MTAMDEKVLRQHLRAELGGLAVRPAPVMAVTERGRSVRTRRRILAACAVAAAAAIAAVLAVPGVAPGGLTGGEAVTMNTPDPSAPGGVFASGTVAGRPWRLALRDISGQGPACLPAVMLNGHHGDVLTARLDQATHVGYPAFLTLLPSLRAAGFGFVDLRPGVTRVAVRLADGTNVTVRPVSVTQCGVAFRLAGFAYAGAAPARIITYSPREGTATSITGWVPFAGRYHDVAARTPTGLWENTPAGRSASAPAVVAGRGTQGKMSWRVSVTLNAGACHGQTSSGPRSTWWNACWNGECYLSSAAIGNAAWSSASCVPVEKPPAIATLVRLPAPSLRGNSKDPAPPHLIAYAGLVASRTVYVVAHLSDGSAHQLRPGVLAGRRYIALMVTKPVRVTGLTLYDAAGTRFATMSSVPASCGVLQLPACG